MMNQQQNQSGVENGWLLFFYTVPSKPPGSRMKIWRMLLRAGAMHFKGSVYILPFSDHHYEFFHWLVATVQELEGEAAFVVADKIESMKNDEIVRLFNENRGKDYEAVEKKVEEMEKRLRRDWKGTCDMDSQKIEDELQKFVKEFQDVAKIDFFFSDARKELEKRLNSIAEAIKSKAGIDTPSAETTIPRRNIKDYQGRTWVTRKKPFIDRMASAWLIKKFIDTDAAFGFINEDEVGTIPRNAVAYDIVGGEFTHVGDLSTFEVLITAFSLRKGAVGELAEIIHQLDLDDDKYANPAAAGLRQILEGIRKTARDDADALQKGMEIMEMLFVSRS